MRIRSAGKQEISGILVIFFEFITAFALIINCNSIYITLAPYDSLIKRLSTWVVLAGLAGIILFSRSFLDHTRLSVCFIYILLFGVYLTGYILATDFYNFTAFFRFAVVFFMIMIYYFLVEGAGKVPKVLIRYGQIMVVIAALSVICWILFSMIRLIPATDTAMTWWNGTDHYTPVNSFFGIYFEPQTIKVFGHKIVRNCAIFVEAPITSMHFSFALLIELFLKKKTSLINTIILIIAIGTTFSATGYIVVMAAVIVRLLIALFSSDKYKQMDRIKKMIILIVIAAIVVGAITAGVLIILGRKGGGSWRIREEDFRAAIKAWFDKLIYGNGVNNFDAVKMHFEGKRATYAGYSNTTSLGTILAEGGIMFGLLYVGAVVMAIIRAVRNKEYNMIFFPIFILVIFTVTIVNYDYIVIFMFVFMGAYRSRGARYIETCELK